MHLLPALRVLDAQRAVVVQQTLADLRVRFLRHRQIERREAARVLVVGRRAQLEQRAERKPMTRLVFTRCALRVI